MNRYLKIALAVAAVVVVAVVGFRQFGGSNVGGPGVGYDDCADRDPGAIRRTRIAVDSRLRRSAGRYVLHWPGDGGPRVTVDIPDGWTWRHGRRRPCRERRRRAPTVRRSRPVLGDLSCMGTPASGRRRCLTNLPTTVDQAVAALRHSIARGLDAGGRDGRGHRKGDHAARAGRPRWTPITRRSPAGLRRRACDQWPSSLPTGVRRIDDVWVPDVERRMLVRQSMVRGGPCDRQLQRRGSPSTLAPSGRIGDLRVASQRSRRH